MAKLHIPLRGEFLVCTYDCVDTCMYTTVSFVSGIETSQGFMYIIMALRLLFLGEIFESLYTGNSNFMSPILKRTVFWRPVF